MWFYRRTPRIRLAGHVSNDNDKFLRVRRTKRTHIFRMRKKPLKFLGHIMRKGELVEFERQGHIKV